MKFIVCRAIALSNQCSLVCITVKLIAVVNNNLSKGIVLLFNIKSEGANERTTLEATLRSRNRIRATKSK